MTKLAVLRPLYWRRIFLVLLIALTLGSGHPPFAFQQTGSAQAALKSISAADFSRLVQTFSEEGGYFRSDNFTSNETSYLHIVDKLREMKVMGGAYVGVGPEQNFTYIAKIRPEIAFIVDIRRQAMVQHLLYKAIFHLADSRPKFLSLLLSRPLSGKNAPNKETAIEKVLEYLQGVKATDKTYKANLAKVRQVIKNDFRYLLSEREQEQLDYVYSAFYMDGLDISYRVGGSNRWGSLRRFPSLQEIILQPDQHDKLGNFLVTDDDYQFVRQLHRQNRIIPVVGDFAGTKALASVGDYLKKNGYTVSAFYVSNVEQYLFQNGVFSGFAANVKKLPINEESVIIRAVPLMRQEHPAQINGHYITTLLQKVSVFIKDFEQGLHTDYWELVTTNYISP